MKLGEACIAANYYKTLEITRFKKKWLHLYMHVSRWSRTVWVETAIRQTTVCLSIGTDDSQEMQLQRIDAECPRKVERKLALLRRGFRSAVYGSG